MVLFVHGIYSNGTTWYDMLNRFEIIGDNNLQSHHIYAGFNSNNMINLYGNLIQSKYYTLTMYELSDRNDGSFDFLSFEKQGKLIKAAVDYLLRFNNAEKVILVGHSMGGLAIYSYLKNEDGVSNTLQIFTIGTPYKGSSMADLFVNLNSTYPDFFIMFDENIEYITDDNANINLRTNSLALQRLAFNNVIFQDVLTFPCSY